MPQHVTRAVEVHGAPHPGAIIGAVHVIEQVVDGDHVRAGQPLRHPGEMRDVHQVASAFAQDAAHAQVASAGIFRVEKGHDVETGRQLADRFHKACNRFFDQYRSYVINYNLGEHLVRAWVERQGGTVAVPERRWALFLDLISSPRLPRALTTGLVLFGVTTLHEFAHGVTCKHYGGEVREVGFLMLLLMPCFYCNVSDAWLFPEKSKRIWVAGYVVRDPARKQDR